MAIPLRYSLKSLWVRRATTIASMLGVALAVFVLASSLMLAEGVRVSGMSPGSDQRVIVMEHDSYTEDDSGFPEAVLGLVAAAPGVQRSAAGSPMVVGESVMMLPFSKPGDDSQNFSVLIRGVTAKSFEVRPGVRVVQGRAPKWGTREVAIGSAIAGQYEGLALGGRFELGKNTPLEVVGIFDAGGSAYESEVWMDLDTLRTSLGWQGYLSSVTAQLSSYAAFDALKLTLQAERRYGLGVERERDYYRNVSQGLFEGIGGLGALVTVIVALGAMLGGTITMHAAVSHRGREIGVLRALGFRPRHVLLAFLCEAVALALVGASFGVVLALLTPMLDFSTTNMETGQALALRFRPSLAVVVVSLVTGAVLGLVGGLPPALKAARVSPSLAMRGSA